MNGFPELDDLFYDWKVDIVRKTRKHPRLYVRFIHEDHLPDVENMIFEEMYAKL